MAQHADGDSIVIGLVNNMPDGALKTTERQFKELLSAAAGHIAVRVRLFSLPEAARTPASRAYIDENYENFDNLWGSRVDGLIVSGTEARASSLAAEPYWQTLTKLIDWAEEHTISTVWSCLAAHAAAYHLDGIERKKFPAKLSGVFDCARVGTHRILADTPVRWCIPHSRSNDLPEAALVAAGYQILSRSPITGADMFMKQGKSLFLFLQGRVIPNTTKARCCANFTGTSADSCVAKETHIRTCRASISTRIPPQRLMRFAYVHWRNETLNCLATFRRSMWKKRPRGSGA